MTMDLKPRYTGEDDTFFDITDDFITSLVGMKKGFMMKFKQILEDSKDMLFKNGEHTFGFKIGEVFMEIDIINEEGFAPLFNDARKISVDDYLDHINNNTKLND